MELMSDLLDIMSKSYHLAWIERKYELMKELQYLIESRKMYDYKFVYENDILVLYFKWQKATEIEEINDNMLLPVIRKKKLERILN